MVDLHMDSVADMVDFAYIVLLGSPSEKHFQYLVGEHPYCSHFRKN